MQTIGSVIGVGVIVGVIAFAFCVVPDAPPTRDEHDDRLADLPPDHGEGLTWDPEWDEEPRPGTGPSRREVEL